MGNFTEDANGYDAEGFRNRADTVYTDSVHPQGTDADDLEVDFVGSSSLKRLNPNGSTTNAPQNSDRLIPVGATVDNGVVEINSNNPA